MYLNKYKYVTKELAARFAWCNMKAGAQCSKEDIPMEFLLDNYEVDKDYMRYLYWTSPEHTEEFSAYVDSLGLDSSFVSRHKRNMYDLHHPKSAEEIMAKLEGDELKDQCLIC